LAQRTGAIAALRTHWKAQQEQRLALGAGKSLHWKAQQEQRLALGAGKSPPEALVFADVNGEPRKPNAVTKEWQRTATAAGMPEATLHSLRHAHASHPVAAGLDILTISRRLGHGSPTITLAVDGHLFPQTDDRAAQMIEAAMASIRTE
jgi:integrase